MTPMLGKELGIVEPDPPAARSPTRARKRPLSFEQELIRFLSKALAPTSESSKTSRIDNLIVTAILNRHLSQVPRGAILDVCCGWPVLLEKMIEQLLKDKTRSGQYHYVACDMAVSTDAFRHKWQKLMTSARKSKLLKMSKIPADVSEPEVFRNALRTAHEDKFDFILLANALHELPFETRPELLLTLVELLKPNGHLVVLDPEPTWLLDPKRWEEIKELHELSIDWETQAVWLPSKVYRTILQKFGCTVTDFDAKRSQTFWVLQANRGAGKITNRDRLIVEATKIMNKALHLQLYQEVERYVECRDGLGAEFSKLGLGPNKQFLLKAVEFFSVCASQARRVEASAN
jgi:SAM-dependent methyltransferase